MGFLEPGSVQRDALFRVHGKGALLGEDAESRTGVLLFDAEGFDDVGQGHGALFR
jgi:hypothetical protein